jgi:hypothetical protein
MEAAAERMRETRWRRRASAVPVRLVVTNVEVDFLLARAYPLKRSDNRSIAEAVSAYLAGSVLEGG